MITKIKLHKTTSYADVVEIEPNAINYFFGSNRTGKLSLGKVIADIYSCLYFNFRYEASKVKER